MWRPKHEAIHPDWRLRVLFALFCSGIGLVTGGAAAALWTVTLIREQISGLEARVADLSDRLVELQGSVDRMQQALAHVGLTLSPIDAAIGALSGMAPGPERLRVALVVYRAARAYGLDPALLVALGTVESAWRPHAVGSAGERGALQVLPSTCWYVGIACSDPYDQIEAGARYLATLLERSRRVEVAIARYHLGHNVPAARALTRGAPYIRRVVRAWQQAARIIDARAD